MKLKFVAFILILVSLLIVIPTGFAVDNHTNNTDADILKTDYYFDSNIDNDTGNGSIDNPYKNLNSSRMVSNSVLHLASGEYDLNYSKEVYNITIIGDNPNNTLIKNIKFTVKSTLTLCNVSLVSSNIVNNGNLTLTNIIFSNSSSTLYGGVIVNNNDAYVSISNSSFLNNTARFGGVIYSRDGFLNITDSWFINNTATGFGGAIITVNSKTNLTRSGFINNTAQYYGGAIYSLYGSFNLTQSIFINNSAVYGGGAFIDDGNPSLIINNSFTGNNATYAGGVYLLSNNMSNAHVSNNTFINNTGVFENDLLETTVPNMIISNGNYTLLYNTLSFNGTIPESYDLRSLGYVTPVKNQGGGGNCWAFAGIAALESCILKATGVSYDFSEENMKNLMAKYSDYGWNMAPNTGGYDDMAIGYLLSWLGPVNDTCDVYSGSSYLSPVFNSLFHVQNMLFIERKNYTDNDGIKKAIIDYGAVSTCIYWTGAYANGKNYYYTGSDGVNHAIAIVGWDDNYSRDNFKTKPAGDGAWIIKNSWGTGSGDNGYYYVSYYDTRCAQLGRKDVTYTFILNDTIKYDKNYQYDIPGRTDVFLNSSSTVWYKNLFTAGDDEYLAAVSTYFEKQTNYTIYIIVNNTLKHTQEGFSNMGYYTLNLNQLIHLNKGDVFEVVFKITVDGEAAFPISEKVSLNKYLYFNNTSFLSYDGVNWTNIYDLKWNYSTHTYNSQVACIKAFTVYDMINTTVNLEINLTDGFNVKAVVLNQYNRPVTGGEVTFTVNNNEVYNVFVKDGVALLPLESGNYNISAVYNNNGYFSSNSSISADVPVLNTTLILNISDNYNPVNLTAKVVNQYGYLICEGNVTFNLDGENYTVDVVNGIAYLPWVFGDFNTHNLSAKYNGVYNKFNTSSNQTSFKIYLKNPNILINISDYYNPVNITVKVVDEFGNTVTMGNVTLNLDGEEFNVSLVNGSVSFIKVFETFGVHNLSVNYSGVEYYYNSSNVEKSFNVYLRSVKISISEDNNYNPVNIIVHVMDVNNNPINYGNVTFTVEGKEIIVKVVNGSACLNYSFKNLGLNTVRANYDGSYYYDHSAILLNLNVSSTILADDEIKTYNSQYKFIIIDNYANPLNNTSINIILNSKQYNLTTNDVGEAVLDITLSPGEYSLIITNPFNGEVKTQKITVVKRIVGNTDITMYYGADKYYTFKVLDDNGNPAKKVNVTLTINNKQYILTSDDNGMVRYKINLYIGVYTVKVTYCNFTVSNKITVKSTIITKDITVKKGKPIKFTAKLVNTNGKALKNKKITFKFKGKKYKVKTNKKGKATLKINKKYKKGKYPIITSYSNLKVKNTIKIK